MSTQPLNITNNEAESRFQYVDGGSVAVAEYQREGDRITFTHTDVPEAMAGRGVAGQLVRTALEFAKRENLKVVPKCEYVAAFIRRNPQYSELVED